MLQLITAIPTILAFWLLTNVFRLIPLPICWKIGSALGALCYKILPKRSATIRKNLNIVSDHTQSLEVTEDLVREVFKRNAANLICASKTYGMPIKKLRKHVTVLYDDESIAAVKQPDGGLLCIAHMGNWELLSKFPELASFGIHPIGALYRPLDNKFADKYVDKQRTKSGCVMFPKQTSVNTLSTFIKNGGYLGVLADQKAGGRKNAVPFFGRDTPRSMLPAILKKRTNANFFSLSVYSPEPAKWIISIEHIPTPTEASTKEIRQLVTTRYEEMFTKHPLDVFWLHRYWRDQKKSG